MTRIPENSALADISASKLSTPSFYRPELDALRFTAFLGVFLYHGMPHEASAYEWAGWLAPWIAAIFRSGAFGVDLFFALSAYLITTLLLREKDLRGLLDVKSFYLRRILRIWPLYFAFLAFAVCLKWFGFRTQTVTAPYIAGYVAMAGNWVYAVYGVPHSVTVPLWSVSIEEQFYLLWPLAIRRCSRQMMGYAAWVLLIASVCCTALILLANRTIPEYALEFNTLVRLEPIALGILLALWFGHNIPSMPVVARAGLLGGGAAVWIIVSRYCEFNVHGPASILDNIVGRPAIALASIALLLGTLGARGFLVNRVTVYLGKISYGLYVIHAFGLLFAAKLLERYRVPFPSAKVALFGLACTTLFAMLSYRWIETPFLSLKDCFTYVSSRPLHVRQTDPVLREIAARESQPSTVDGTGILTLRKGVPENTGSL